MNTNEFRHPKERLQNLSSRHKVSTFYFHWFDCVCALWREDVGESWGESDHWRGLSYNLRNCLPPCAYLWCAGWLWSSSPCRSGVHWGLMRLCMGSVWTMGVIYHNFAKIGQFVQMFVSPVFFPFLFSSNWTTKKRPSIITRFIWKQFCVCYI